MGRTEYLPSHENHRFMLNVGKDLLGDDGG